MPETLVTSGTSSGKVEPRPGSAMGFLQHLEELRRRIFHCIVAVIVAFCVCFWYAGRIFAVMQKPLDDALKANHLDAKLVYLNPVEPFNLFIKIGFIAALFVASPYILYQVWMFISPGLYKHEKKWVVPFVLATAGLFISGGALGFFVVYPRALDFFVAYGHQFQPMVTVNEYTDLFMTVILGMGIVFEIPILIFFLAMMGLVSAGFLLRNFRYALLVIAIIAAIVTPTPDIVNMLIFMAPMTVLYILSIGVAWIVHPANRRARKAKKEAAAS
jgi:sec-independent protein translocase protein TatC